MARQFRRISICSVLLIATLGVASCSSDSNPAAKGGSTQMSGTLTVFGASSLTKSFTALRDEFIAAYPHANIKFNFAASSDLVTQIQQGAPADVFASADMTNMEKLAQAGKLSGTALVFAKNKLAIAVAHGNPKHLAALADLTTPGLSVLLCDVAVPCGRLAAQVLRKANVKLTPKSYEPTVKAALAKVELGEADAAIVYVSDVKTSKRVDSVAIPDAVNATTSLPIGVVRGSKNEALAKAWDAFVVAHTSEFVAKYGFLNP